MKKGVIFALTVMALTFSAMSAAVFAQTIAPVQINTPSNTNNPPDLGINSSSGLTDAYWIGQFPITINPPSGPTGDVYCMTPNGEVYVGSTYQAIEQPVPDNGVGRDKLPSNVERSN